MSTILRDATRAEINKLVSEHIGILATNTTDDIGQMRLRQGIIQGLQMAEQILTDQYRAMNG